jgi:uncharacterized membrane protein
MQPALVVAVLWMVFAGTHIGLASAPLRARLVARLGEMGFTLLFYVIAAASFAVLIAYFAAHRFAGAPGLSAASLPLLRVPLMLLIVAGFMLMVPALLGYPRLPSALFGQAIGTPRGVERITRHPFFAGMALFGAAHALLASHLVGTVFFGSLALFSAVGAWHQDRKLLARRGQPYAAYLAGTSAVPFAAILAGRQHLIWKELPIGGLLGGVAAALALRIGHDGLWAHDGAWITVAVVGGGALAGINAWRRSRRVRRRARSVPASAH